MLTFFIRYHKDSEIFISIAVLFLLKNFRKFNKAVNIKKKVQRTPEHAMKSYRGSTEV